MPYIVVAYDISDDRKRLEVCEKLKSMGFTRIQRSLYIARGGSSKAKDVARALQRYIDRSTDSVLVMVIPREVLEKTITIGVNRVEINEQSYGVI
ncbi:CRISPR-associated protein Cas2 [Ignisphaera aggregans DSM 17230]|uniref:CRISPR-associated endoribonuclease Cas2 n=1 Tax=Ignisphaera aggregans (strain DSM 17230 / JCM 13409 / AQ1.S1) TaxID=583356 RepID=E0STX1_IGNAA|nr:CRISPR-associated protein Cas2 [Ignisphaera aggregans DSM 17230]